MFRLFLASLCAFFLAHGAAWAEGEKPCTSITERDCAPPPRIAVGPNLRVETFTRQRTIFFPVPEGEAGEELRAICTDGKCACTEHVQFFEFKGPHPGFRAVNGAERSAASHTHCSLENSNVSRDTLAFAVSAHLISAAIFELEYCHGCGGSCHGSTTLATYDEQDGRLLHVGDFLKPGAADALRRHMIDFIVKEHGNAESEAYLRKQLSEELSRRQLEDEGLYAERGTLYIDLNSFALSCADGAFHPVPIPPEFIKPGLAGMLK